MEKQNQTLDGALDHDRDCKTEQCNLCPNSLWVKGYHRVSARCLQNLAAFAGSSWTFGALLCLVVGWALAGVFLHGSQVWQIVMQNASSIQCYLWDITLIFVQRSDFEKLSQQLSLLQASSRQRAVELPKLLEGKELAENHPGRFGGQLQLAGEGPVQQFIALPAKSWYDGCADWASTVAGSPWSQLIYAGGIVAWLALGPMLHFDNNWQLYVNTATAVELSIMTTFLQNTKRRHRQYMHLCSQQIGCLDLELHERLCQATCSTQELVAESKVDLSEQQQMTGHRSICKAVEGYANFIGSIAGISLSIVLFAVWLGLGKLMGYGNANWWLIIGTFTGLAGFIDAFVLRNMLSRQTSVLLEQCNDLDSRDSPVLEVLSIPQIPSPPIECRNFIFQISVFVSKLVGTLGSLAAALLLVVVLLAVATAMHWSQTAQLLCNTPTMILEGGLLLILMMSHMSGHQHMRARLQAILQRRISMQRAFDSLSLAPPATYALDIKMQESSAIAS